MNKFFRSFYILFVSLLFMLLQSTILSPFYFGHFAPDLNLILIVYLALIYKKGGGFGYTVLNGFIMDALSGAPFGIHILSRASLFLLLKGFGENIYSGRWAARLSAIFVGTLFTWGFVAAALFISGNKCCNLSLKSVVIQGIVNILVGLPVLSALKRLDEKL